LQCDSVFLTESTCFSEEYDILSGLVRADCKDCRNTGKCIISAWAVNFSIRFLNLLCIGLKISERPMIRNFTSRTESHASRILFEKRRVSSRTKVRQDGQVFNPISTVSLTCCVRKWPIKLSWWIVCPQLSIMYLNPQKNISLWLHIEYLNDKNTTASLECLQNQWNLEAFLESKCDKHQDKVHHKNRHNHARTVKVCRTLDYIQDGCKCLCTTLYT